MNNETHTTHTPATNSDGTLDDKALDHVAGGDMLGFLADVAGQAIISGVAEAIHPHGPNVVIAAPQQVFVPQPTYMQQAPVYAQPPVVQYVPQQYAPQQYVVGVPAPVVVNSGW